LMHSIDILLIDTPSGISSNVIYFNKSAQEIIVVISPEPTSMTDAYALMKVLSLRYSKSDFKILVNMAMNGDEAHGVFRKIKQLSDRFLNVSIEYTGYILFDENVTKSVKLQKLVTDIYPDSAGSRCFAALANKIHTTAPANFSVRGENPFWEKVLQNSLE
jgi:flagellar biosynthesis protein FlhG